MLTLKIYEVNGKIQVDCVEKVKEIKIKKDKKIMKLGALVI